MIEIDGEAFERTEAGGTALTLQDGDTVLITFAEQYTQQEVERVRVHLERAFPTVVFALLDGVQAVARYRPVR